MKTFALLFSLLVGSAFATYGVDFSLDTCQGGVQVSDFQCLSSNGYSFAIIEVWDGGEQFDSNIASCVSNAWTAGFAHVDVYAFICPECDGNGDPAGTVQTIVNGLNSNGVQYGMLWFDIEQCDGCWADVGTNQNYIATAVSTAVSMGVQVGIYSSPYEWSQTVGDWTGLSGYPLWYAHYDGNPSFDDWSSVAFGGWSSPAIKQYTDSGPCINIDSNWYPD